MSHYSDYFLYSLDTITHEQYLGLVMIIENAQDAYYNNNVSIMSDEEFDVLFQMLKNLELIHPDRIVNNSPSQNLSMQHTKNTEFVKAKHNKPMLSLDNTYNDEDVRNWNDSLVRMLWKMDNNLNELRYIVEPKYDGIGIELIYKWGTLIQAITRWDGFEWEDVTNNAKQVYGIVWNIPYLGELHVRWEIMMPKSEFEKLNNERLKSWESLFANPRNAASGTMKQLDSAIVKQRWLVCYLYDVL